MRLQRIVRSLRGFERINWTALGAAVGVVSAVLLGVYSDVNTIVPITAGLAVTIIFMQIGEIAQRDRTGEILGTYYKIRRDRELHRYVEELVRAYLPVQDLKNDVFAQRAKTLLEASLDELSRLADGELHVDTHEELLFAIQQLASCKRELKACSWQDKIEYWDSPEGRCYVKAHRELIKGKKGKATRVFILRRDELDAYKRILLSQAEIGIEVRIAEEERLPPDCLEAYVLYDDSAVRIERLTRGFHKSATLSIDKNDIERYKRKFEEIWLRSKPLAEVFPNDVSDTSQCRMVA